ncbi:hypothetical protein [Aquimarina sp. SS2-1]|uniref:hypothetical protein n=1 Tax=Aquimarina besae TaxID=3342247 RepID=UPI00366CD43B
MSGHDEASQNLTKQLLEARSKRIEEINRNWADYANQTTFATNEAEEGLLDAYFAEQITRQFGIPDGTYTYTFGGDNNTSTLDQKKRIAQIIFGRVSPELKQNGQHTAIELITAALTEDSYSNANGDTVTFEIFKTEERISYAKIDKGVLGGDAFILVKGFALKDKEATIEIFEKSPFLLMESETPLTVIQYDSLEAEEPNETVNKTQLKGVFNENGEAVVKIKFRPKVEDPDTVFEEWKEKFKPVVETATNESGAVETSIRPMPRPDDLDASVTPIIHEPPKTIDLLWLKVQVSGEQQNYEEEFLNESENAYFKLKKCDCGEKYDGQFRCTSYGRTVKVYGPIYKGSYKLKDYPKWNEIISKGIVTSMEKDIFIIMSPNEGNIDSVQSYDSEILTAGAMQKTVNPTGQGEFPIQVAEFKDSNPEKYKCLFEHCGWTVENNTMFYKDPDDPNAQKITGSDLKRKIREGFDASTFGSRIKCKPLEPIVNAVNDNDFQVKQIEDFISRLRDKVLPIVPRGYSHTLGDFLTSRLGRATALDHHINRPAYVRNDLGNSLNNFFTRNPNVSKNPLTWGENHQVYENEILEHYGYNRRGTDMADRFNKMKNR